MNKINSFNCILCNSYDLVFELKVRDNDKTNIFKCKKCNLIQLHPRLEIIRERLEDGELDSQDRNRVYSSHDYNKNMNMKKRKTRLDLWVYKEFMIPQNKPSP